MLLAALAAALLLAGCGLVPRGSALGNLIGKTSFVDQARERCQAMGWTPAEPGHRDCVERWAAYLEAAKAEELAEERAAYGGMVPAGAAIQRSAQPLMPPRLTTCSQVGQYVTCQ